MYMVLVLQQLKIVEEANVSADTRVKDLTDDELGRIREVVDSYKVEGDLRREQNLNIKRLMEIFHTVVSVTVVVYQFAVKN